MGDRMFASEGDSGYVARLGSSWESGQWNQRPTEPGQPGSGLGDSGRWSSIPPARSPVDDATAGIARRLQGRLDRHLWLLDRLAAERSGPLAGPAPSELPELLETGVRMRRDTESLLLLCGHEPGVRPTGPRRLDELMDDVAALCDEPRRVQLRQAAAATVGAAAAVEFLHVLAELVDHTLAAHPGARLELAGRVEAGGATVDVLVDGRARINPDAGWQAAAAAEQMSQRSRYGIALHRPLGGPSPSGPGLVASVHCPAAAVTVSEPEPPATRYDTRYDMGGGGGLGADATGGLSGLGESIGLGDSDWATGWTRLGSDLGNGNAVSHGNGLNGNGLNGNGLLNGNGNGHGRFDAPAAPEYSPSQSSKVDELFGPLLDLPLEPIDDRYATPIFEAIASAWFREGERTGDGPLDWETPHDSEWREAAARAARSEPDPPPAANGLPHRRPGDHLVPPPRSQTQNGKPAGGASEERVPDRVRDRLSTYQRGLREGRHRAPSQDGTEDW